MGKGREGERERKEGEDGAREELHRTGKLGAHGEQEMNQLLQHFRASKALEDGIEVQPMVDADEATVEFSQFKSFLYGVVHDPQQTRYLMAKCKSSLHGRSSTHYSFCAPSQTNSSHNKLHC